MDSNQTIAPAHLILIPGYMLDREMWADVEARLEGLGDLTYADISHDTSIAAMAERIVEAAPQRFVVVGFSMGGYVAREVVRRVPDRVAGLVLIATSSRGDSEVAAQRKATVGRTFDPSKFTGLSRSAIASSFAAGQADETRVARVRAMGERLGGATFQRQSSLIRVSDQMQLAEITCPTLIIAGTDDQLRLPEEARELHAGIKTSTLIVIEGSGHMIPIEKPDELATAVAGWFREYIDA